MKQRSNVTLGDLIVAAFDQAALYTDDPAEQSKLATAAVQRFMERQEKRQREPQRQRVARRAA